MNLRVRVPFLKSQGFRLLCERGDVRRFLRPEVFRSWRERDNDQRPESEEKDLGTWVPLKRDELLDRVQGGGPLNRLVIVSDAGWGKTTNMKWLHAHLNASRSSCVTVKFQLAELPSSLNTFLTESVPRELGRALGAPGQARLRQLTEQLQKSGRLVFLFDSLDQLRGDEPVGLIREILRNENVQDCPIVLSARSHAVIRFWKELFKDHDWRFAHLEDFDEHQQERCLGVARYMQISQEARSILSTPRVLEYLRDIVPFADLAEMSSSSDVYYHAMAHMIEEGLPDQMASKLGCYPDTPVPKQNAQVKLAWLILSAIAFEMLVGSDAKDVYSSILEADDDGELLGRVFQRVAAVKRSNRETYDAYRFHHDISCLGPLNVAIDHGFLDGFSHQDDAILWRDRSLQEFAAAYWASNFIDADDLDRLCVYAYFQTKSSRDFYWFWRFVAEMPSRARNRQWVNAMRIMYGLHRPTKPLWRRWFLRLLWLLGHRLRSHEMIYRSWKGMHESANGLQLIRQFRGRNSARAAARISANVVELPGGTFTMGSPKGVGSDDELPQREVTLSRFGICMFQVTNAQYELFDPSHRWKRWGGLYERKAFNSEGRGKGAFPVVNVTWWDAWAFCKWLGSEKFGSFTLPTEAQWEYACRAGSKERFCRIDDPQAPNRYRDLATEKDLKRVAWFNQNSGGRTHRVGELEPNAFGVFDMHGNVWEWCLDWYDFNFYHHSPYRDPVNTLSAHGKVKRGASWTRQSKFCRCAYRSEDDPAYFSTRVGFRVAVEPANPTEP